MRLLFTFLALALAVSPARAHFIFLIPSPDQKSATMVFSDTLGPDEGVLITKAAKTKLHALDASGKAVEVKMTEQKHHYDVRVGGELPLMIGGVCEYGVLTKKGDPFLLMYYPKTVLMRNSKKASEPAWLSVGSKQIPLEVVKGDEKSGKLTVLFDGKPLGGADVTVLFDHGKSDEMSLKADAKGQFNILSVLDKQNKEADLIGVRVKHIEKKNGELDGKKYAEVRHYATLVIRPGVNYIEKDAKAKSAVPGEVSFVGDDKKADPAATKLLADARSARALWHKFPGFSAWVEINQDGKKMPCKLTVSAEGRVTLDSELADRDAKQGDLLKKVKGEIASLVSHRMSGGPSDTPCAFTDSVEDHPQGRLITVLNDELHSSYRIRDRQILEVNRSMGDAGRFTITVLENTWNKEKTYLPAHYVVNSWDKGGSLKNSAAHRSTWVRVGAYDLPESATTAVASPAGLSVRTITFSKHKLESGASARR